ncbi:PREDICTED: uncharacterized protein LOC109349478 [Lupinus angustifolius]|uniref:uncharacterized protein LOC109349478 n=1 Tax=Lupinus angustifolius TaxID=3871 RepID=UPI00092EDB76|nr:PREDICTED: uncharacterized protein LOC109349478 [Lupinus angustifolius]
MGTVDVIPVFTISKALKCIVYMHHVKEIIVLLRGSRVCISNCSRYTFKPLLKLVWCLSFSFMAKTLQRWIFMTVKHRLSHNHKYSSDITMVEMEVKPGGASNSSGGGNDVELLCKTLQVEH